MSVRISIRKLVEMRQAVADSTLLDYLQLTVFCPDPGIVDTQHLQQCWSCSQSSVSRRLAAIANAGLADITNGCGVYYVHWVSQLQGTA